MRRDGCEGAVWGWAAEREQAGKGGGRRGGTHSRSHSVLGQMPVHSSVGVHACMGMSARTHDSPITSCVVGVLASAGMAKAPSGTGRQGRVSLYGVWGGRTVLGCWGGRARARGGSRESAGRCWVWLVTAPDCLLCAGYWVLVCKMQPLF